MLKNTTELGSLINKARKEIGISQRELARKANMDPAEVSRIEAGTRLKPNVLYLKGIADTLNLSMVELMKLAGYSDLEMNFGRDLTDKRSIADYQKQIQSYEQFYFDVLEEIENRRKIDFAIKGCIADLIDKIELSKLENKEITNDDILERLNEIIPMISPNLEKLDKSKYPPLDKGLLPNIEINSNLKYTISKELNNKKK